MDIRQGEHKKLVYENGRYYVNTGITVQEWKEMLLNENIFYPKAKDMILHWYRQEGHQATSKIVYKQYYPELKNTPYNGTVQNFSRLVLEYLNNRFWIEDSTGSNKISYWCIPFHGWHENYNPSNNFVWQIREELVQAIQETPSFFGDDVHMFMSIADESVVVKGEKEGGKKTYYITKYERNHKNRDAAIKLNKQKYGHVQCEACGFDFELMYGEIGKDYIEVHHNKPLYSLDDEIIVNPETDLNCICANCHRMIHRRSGSVLTVNELKKLLMHKNSQ